MLQLLNRCIPPLYREENVRREISFAQNDRHRSEFKEQFVEKSTKVKSTCALADAVFLSIRVRKRYSLSVCHARATTRLSATTFLFEQSREMESTRIHTYTAATHTQSADRWTSFGREMIHLPRGTKLHLRSFIRTWVFTRDSDSPRHNSFLHLCNRKRKYTPGRFEPVTFLSDSFDPLRWIYKRFLPALPRIGSMSVLKKLTADDSARGNLILKFLSDWVIRRVVLLRSYRILHDQINWEVVETVMKVNRLNS